MIKNIFKLGIDYIKKIKTENNSYAKKIHQSAFLYEIKKEKIEKINQKEVELFFLYLANKYNVDIISGEEINNKLLNKFYNNFFSKYKIITIDDDLYISYNDVLQSKDEEYLLIGNDCSEFLYIKKNQLKNGVFISGTNDSKDMLENESTGYTNVYYFLIESILNKYQLDIDKEYLNFKSQ